MNAPVVVLGFNESETKIPDDVIQPVIQIGGTVYALGIEIDCSSSVSFIRYTDGLTPRSKD